MAHHGSQLSRFPRASIPAHVRFLLSITSWRGGGGVRPSSSSKEQEKWYLQQAASEPERDARRWGLSPFPSIPPPPSPNRLPFCYLHASLVFFNFGTEREERTYAFRCVSQWRPRSGQSLITRNSTDEQMSSTPSRSLPTYTPSMELVCAFFFISCYLSYIANRWG